MGEAVGDTGRDARRRGAGGLWHGVGDLPELPHAGIGIGRFHNIPNQSLVNFQPTNARMADAIIGARYHLTDRFMIRVDYAIYTAYVSDQRSLEYRAATAGLSFFF